MAKIIKISLFLLIGGFVTVTSCLDFDPESEATLFARPYGSMGSNTLLPLPGPSYPLRSR